VQTILKLLYEESNEKGVLNQLQSVVEEKQPSEYTKSRMQSNNIRINSEEQLFFEISESENHLVSNITQTQHQIPTLINRIPVRKPISNDSNKVRNQLVSNFELKTGRNKEKRKNKIMLIGDSHIRGFATKILINVDNHFEVMGNVMPGARLQDMIQICEKEVNSLSKEDIAVIWGGSLDVAKNEANNGLLKLKDFISRNKTTNFILIPLPHRYDLTEFSCVNAEIKVFNRKLNKIMKIQENVKILDLELDRSCFTKHGLHLNSTGKNKIEANILTKLCELTTKMLSKVLPLGWQQNWTESCEALGTIKTMGLNLQHPNEETVVINSENEKIRDGVSGQLSDLSKKSSEEVGNAKHHKIRETIPAQDDGNRNRRNRRPPTRSEDFLWT
jgi:uncharacterized Zn finger protein